MKFILCSVQDVVAESYGAPFMVQNKNVAIRTFRQLVNDKGSRVNPSPGDYNLHQLAEFDDETGVLEVSASPVHLANGQSLVTPQELQS